MSLVGFAFKLWFFLPVKNFSGCYDYAVKFIRGTVPNLGFYTGMAIDHSYYILGKLNGFVSFLDINSYLQIFLSVFVYLGFLYILFKAYKKTGVALWFFALLSVFPIELFQNLDIGILLISYISIISLFILIKKNNWGFFILCLIISGLLAVQYYTATMAIILISLGFTIAILIKSFIKYKNIKSTFKSIFQDKHFLMYLLVLIISSLLMLLFTEMWNFTGGKLQNVSDINHTVSYISTVAENSTQNIINNSTKNVASNNTQNIANVTSNSTQNIANVTDSYQAQRFFGFSAIGWQSIFFVFCGFTFVLYAILCLFKKTPWGKDDEDILYGIIPISMLGLAFLYINYPARIFDYLSFFAILALKIPKKYLKFFLLISFIFMAISNIYAINDKRIFFGASDGELAAAREIAVNNLNGRIFSDECFADKLILSDYYSVTGTDDKDEIVKGLFYSADESMFKNAVNNLKNSGVSYIATTKRMRNEYILMLNFPQKPLTNENFYKKDLNKIYDNGDVEVYSAKIKNESPK